jgi:hypothetical protein
MSDLWLLDTTIYLNLLNIPGFNQEFLVVKQEFKRKLARQNQFVLPLVSILETGNHIAKLSDGGSRRKYAEEFCIDVQKALHGMLPYKTTKATDFLNKKQFLAWLKNFPDSAMQNKSEDKPNEGKSLADHLIIQEWKKSKEDEPGRPIFIWSLDKDLAAYGEPSNG